MAQEGTWYHGSPLQLTMLRAGSTITRDRDVARVFSHKPPIVSMNDDGTILHTGTAPGYLYRIDEALEPEDAYPHPRTTMPPGLEWLTRRELRLSLIGPTVVREEERLTGARMAELRRLHQGHKAERSAHSRGASNQV
jgi:hypothetical protein